MRSQVVVSTTLLFPTRVLLEDVDTDGDDDAILLTAYSAVWYAVVMKLWQCTHEDTVEV